MLGKYPGIEKEEIQEQEEENKEKSAVYGRRLTKHQNYLEEKFTKNKDSKLKKEDTKLGSKPIKEAAIAASEKDPSIKEKLCKIEQDVKKVHIFVNLF
jgi:hypothetical protein